MPNTRSSARWQQYVVKEARTCLWTAWPEEGKTFQPDVLFLGGDGRGELAAQGPGDRQGIVGHERARRCHR